MDVLFSDYSNTLLALVSWQYVSVRLNRKYLRIIVGEGRPKWAPEVKWATPITANLVNAMAKIMMLVSNPSREGTMECVACELQHKIKQ